jgi:hypothetical protein
MNSLVNANQSQQSTGGNPYDTKDIGGSNARLANMQRALTGGKKRKSTKGGAAPGALPNGDTVVPQYSNASPALNQNFVKLAAVNNQAEANRTFTGGKQSGGRRKKGRKTHKKRHQYAKKTRRRYKH